jgi:hypothetical protein
MNRNWPIWAAIAALVFSTACFAGIDNTIGARGEGLGFSFSVLADEPFGALYNPAGTAFINGWQTQMQFVRPTRYGFSQPTESPYMGLAGVNYRFRGLGNVALDINQIGSTSSPTTITTTTAIILSYARLLRRDLAVGANTKYLLETNFGKRKVYDMDLGASYRPEANFAFAAAGENLLKAKYAPDWQGITEHLDRKMRLTAGYFVPLNNTLGTILAGWQMTQAGESKTINTSLVNVGSEWWFATNSNISLAIRGGYTIGQATLAETRADYNRFHAGFSLNFNLAGRDLRLDYGFRSYPFKGNGEMNADHSIAVSYGFGGVPGYGKKHIKSEPVQVRHEEIKPEPPQSEAVPAPAESQKQPIPPPTAQVEQAPPVQPPVEAPTVKMPAYNQPAGTGEYLKLAYGLDVSDISIGDERRIVFYLRPTKVVKLTTWKLFIFKAKLKDWNEEKAQAFSLHRIEAKGIPPINVIWNGLLNDGMMVPSGKYFFIMTGADKFGRKYLSDWCKFTIN